MSRLRKLADSVSVDVIALFLTGVLGSVALWVLVSQPDRAFITRTVTALFEALSFVSLAVIFSMIILGVLIGRVLFEDPRSINRAPIVGHAPEDSVTGNVPTSIGSFETLLNGVAVDFEKDKEAAKMVAMYGNRWECEDEEIPENIKRLFDELTVTARDAYAVSESCTVSEASDAVKNGVWTSDRVAAAFLAENAETAPEFTTLERLVTWFVPERVFKLRVERVISAIEREADAFLTFDGAVERSESSGGGERE